MQHAILFDIDGTLLHAKGLGRPAFAEAFQIAYGAPIDADRISFIGATDTAIIRALAAEQGLPSTPAQEERFAIELTKRLEPRLAQGPIHVYPGVRPLLQALRDQGFRLGIVTGNLRPTAWAKLIHAGLADLFDFGAYANDAPDRDAIAAIACRRANALGATPALLIGDTPRDIQAAHANRLPCLAVTVAGWLPPQDLSAAEATLATYTDLPVALRAIHALIPPPPLPIRVLAWELTRRCPMACKHCRGAARDTAPAGELTTPEALRVIDSLAAAYPPPRRKPLLILTGGEPMYRHDLETLVRHATARGIPTVLAPCGRFATPDRLRALKDAGIRGLSISIDGPDAPTHDAFRGIPGAFQIALDALAAARQVGLPFQINHTVTRATLHTLRQMRDLAKAQGATRIDYFFLVPVGRATAIADQCPTDEQTLAALDQILDLDAEGSLPIHVTCEPRILERLQARRQNTTALFSSNEGHPSGHPAASTGKAAPVCAGTCPHAHPGGHPGGHPGTQSSFNGCMAGAGFCFLSHDGHLQPCGFYDADCGDIRAHNCDLPATYRASTLLNALHGGPICLARARYQRS